MPRSQAKPSNAECATTLELNNLQEANSKYSPSQNTTHSAKPTKMSCVDLEALKTQSAKQSIPNDHVKEIAEKEFTRKRKLLLRENRKRWEILKN